MAEAVLQVQIKALVDGLDQLKSLGDAVSQNVKGFDALGESGDALKGVLGGISEALKGSLEALKENSETPQEFARGIDQLAASLESFAKSLDESTQSGSELKGFIEGIVGGLKDYAATVRKGGDENDHFKDKLKDLAKEFGEAKEQAVELAKKIAEFTGLGALIGSVLSAISVEKFFEEGVKGATDFEDAMARLSATTGRTQDDLAALGEEAAEVGAKLNFGSAESVDALTQLTQGIGDADEALKALQPTMELARVTNLGLAEAATFVTTSLSQYGLAADQASTITDTLVVASQTAGLSMTELVRQFQNVGAFAGAAGLTIKDTAVILAGFAEAGLRGRIASTALLEVFGQLGDASSNFRKSLGALGIDSNNLGTVFQQLAQKGSRAELALASFSDRTRAGLRKLLADGGASLDALNAKLGNVEGASARAAKAIEDTLSKAAGRAQLALGDLAEKLILPSLPTLTEGFDRLSKALNEFGKSDTFKRLQQAFVDLTEKGVLFLQNALSSINFDDLTDQSTVFIGQVGNNLDKIADAARTTGAAIAAVGNLIGFVYNTIRTVIASILGVAVAAAIAVLQVAQASAVLRGNLEEVLSTDKKIALLKESFKDLDKVASESAANMGKNITHLAQNFDDVANSGEHAKDGIDAAAKASADASVGILKLATSTETAEGPAEDLAVSMFGLAGVLQHIQDLKPPDFSNVVDQSTQLNTALAGIGTAFESTDTSSAALQVQLDAVAAEMTDLQAAGQGTSERFKELNDRYNELSSKLLNGVAFENTRRAVAQLNDEIDQEVTKFRALQRSGQDTATATAEFEQKMRDLNAQLENIKADHAQSALDGLTESFKTLGIQSAGQLRLLAAEAKKAFDDIAGAATQSIEDQNQVRAAFLAFVQKELSALQFEDEAARKSAESKLLQQAATLGLTDKVQGLIDKFEGLGRVELGGDKIGKGLRDIGHGFDDVGQKGNQLGVVLDGVTFKTKEEANEFERMGGKAGALGPVLSELQGFYSEFSAHSSAAVTHFTEVMKEFFTGAQAFSIQALTDGTNIIKLGEAAAKAGKFVEEQIAQQEQGVQGLIEQYDNLGDAAIQAMAQARGGADALAASLAGDAAAARAGSSAFDLLGAADLSGLASALDGIAARVRQVKEQALEATAALKDMLRSTQDQIDELLGNQEAIENRRHDEALAQIEVLRAQGGDPETISRLQRAENELHNLKINNIREQQAEAAAAQQKQHDAEVADQQQQAAAQQQQAATQQQNLNAQLQTQKQITEVVKQNVVLPGTGGGGFLGGLAGGNGTQVPQGPGASGLSGAVAPIEVNVNIENAIGTEDQFVDNITRRIAQNLRRLGELAR